MEPSHNIGQIPFQIWGEYHEKWALYIFLSRQFSKNDIWRLKKDTSYTKSYYGSYEV